MFDIVSHWDKGKDIKDKLRQGSLSDVGGYQCHSDNLGTENRKSEHIALDGFFYMHPCERIRHVMIKTDWSAGCKHTTSKSDKGCDGCKNQIK
ncbi:MAG: hypothetical protein KAR40_11045 [Candidatus Sabulitectum sp.]|nr:hypothetical protein [Candidatus Sabulitectum sp.]